MWGDGSKHAYRKHITVKTSKWQVKRRVEEQKRVKEIFLKVILMVTIISNCIVEYIKGYFLPKFQAYCDTVKFFFCSQTKVNLIC